MFVENGKYLQSGWTRIGHCGGQADWLRLGWKSYSHSQCLMAKKAITSQNTCPEQAVQVKADSTQPYQ
jgi:hypothetical protein